MLASKKTLVVEQNTTNGTVFIMSVATFPQTMSNSLKIPFIPETFFVLKFNANPITNAVTINCKEFPERNGATIFEGIASVRTSNIVRFPIELCPNREDRIPTVPGLNK